MGVHPLCCHLGHLYPHATLPSFHTDSAHHRGVAVARLRPHEPTATPQAFAQSPGSLGPRGGRRPPTNEGVTISTSSAPPAAAGIGHRQSRSRAGPTCSREHESASRPMRPEAPARRQTRVCSTANSESLLVVAFWLPNVLDRLQEQKRDSAGPHTLRSSRPLVGREDVDVYGTEGKLSAGLDPQLVAEVQLVEV